jgi:hypothetical protein
MPARCSLGQWLSEHRQKPVAVSTRGRNAMNTCSLGTFVRRGAATLALLALAGCASPPVQVNAVPDTRFTETTSPAVTLAEARRLGYRIVDENGKTVYCRDQVETGSHVRKEAVCLTAEELAAARDASARNLEQMQRLTPPPACSRLSKTAC